MSMRKRIDAGDAAWGKLASITPEMRTQYTHLLATNPQLAAQTRARFLSTGAVQGFGTGTAEASLVGKTVVLRRLTFEDEAKWTALLERNTVAPSLGPDETFEQRLEVGALASALGRMHTFGIFTPDGELIGELTLTVLRGAGMETAFVTVWVDEAHQGSDVATHACVLGGRYAFETLGVQRLEIDIDPAADGLRRALSWAGLRDEGVAHRAMRWADEWQDCARYAITADEWDGVSGRLYDAVGAPVA